LCFQSKDAFVSQQNTISRRDTKSELHNELLENALSIYLYIRAINFILGAHTGCAETREMKRIHAYALARRARPWLGWLYMFCSF
jgi:hypothetical protein